MGLQQRYAILTVDTGLLPESARLIITSIGLSGEGMTRALPEYARCAQSVTSSMPSMCSLSICAAPYFYPEEMCEVVRWLDRSGQDVQLHTHPEVLPKSFSTRNRVEFRPEYMNGSADAWAGFIISHFAKMISEITGKEILAYRSASFRWNGCSIRALKAANILLSFNNSMRAYRAGRCVFSEPTRLTYAWSNGIIEVPVTEKQILISRKNRVLGEFDLSPVSLFSVLY